MSEVVTSIALGEDFACALKTEGSLWCWGRNQYGQLGDGTFNDQPKPVKLAPLGNDVAQFAVSANSACVVKKDASVWCWGRGRTPTVTPQFKLKGQKSVAVGDSHACALSSAGDLSCWGSNTESQVGVPGGRSSGEIPPTVVLTQVVSMSPGWLDTCATRTDNTLWCWGNHYPLFPYAMPAPQAVYLEVSGSGHNRCVRNVSKAVLCWGENVSGEVGDGTTGSWHYGPSRSAARATC